MGPKPLVVDLGVAEGARRYRVLTRISDDKLRSIPQQVADCSEYVAKLGSGAAVDRVYNLGEQSGFSITESAIYQRMLADARAGDFAGLVARDSSRLGRDYWEKLGTLRDLRAAKVELHILEEGGRFDFEDKMQKVKSWASTWADDEKKREEIRKSVRATADRREMGFPTVQPPFGYRSVRAASAGGRKVWRIEEREAAKVRALFEARIARPDATVASLARECGLDAKLARRALANRAYTGGFVWNGAFKKCDASVVAPIVDDATFERAKRAVSVSKAS